VVLEVKRGRGAWTENPEEVERREEEGCC